MVLERKEDVRNSSTGPCEKKSWRIGLLGGSFDPPHIGHVQLVKYVLDLCAVDGIWPVPCFEHMFGKKMAPPDHRLKMTQLACECDGRLKAFSYEIDHQLAGETYFFVKRLMGDPSLNNCHAFSYIIGQDNANSFDKWVNFEYLHRTIRFVVVPRKGVEPDPRAQWYRNSDFHLALPPTDSVCQISSTEVRQMLRDGDERAGQFLDPKVHAYILKNGLYR